LYPKKNDTQIYFKPRLAFEGSITDLNEISSISESCDNRNVCIAQQLLDDYPKCFIVGADNVGSKQMQQIRMSLRGVAVVLMGKNTMMRKAIRGHLERNPALEK
jgi:hypothetical protein